MIFQSTASFQVTHVRGHAYFVGARFLGPTVFRGFRSDGDASFEGCQFFGDAQFARASFGGTAFFLPWLRSGDPVTFHSTSQWVGVR